MTVLHIRRRQTRNLLFRIWLNLSRRRQIQLFLLLLVILLSGAAELASLGAVLPFITVLGNPELLWRHELVQKLANTIGVTRANDLLVPASVLFSFAAIFAASLRMVNLWFSGRLTADIGSDLSCSAYERTLFQPYHIHVRTNSSAIVSGATVHVTRTVQAINAVLQLVNSVIISISLFVGLILIDWVIALSMIIVFGGVYGILGATARRELRRNSSIIANTTDRQVKLLQEGVGAFREVLLSGNQLSYVKIYRETDLPNRLLQAKNQFLSVFPRYAIEALAIVVISILGVLLVLQSGTGEGYALPLLGAFALGAQRLLPSLQQSYTSWASLNGYNADLYHVIRMLDQALPQHVSVTDALPLYESIRFEDVHFRYENDQPEILRGINLKITRGERICVVGATGSGKSTMIDILMGLLSPSSGRVLIDNLDISDPELTARWRKSISHVPQSIYLADASIAENIAFGVQPEDIDLELLKCVASQAQIGQLIDTSPDGYNTLVGERGIRFSGGQIQRIGIARALYKRSEIIVLDEATSALDNATEQAIVDVINGLSKNLTVIMIAHRSTTVKRYNRVVRIENGLLHDISSY